MRRLRELFGRVGALVLGLGLVMVLGLVTYVVAHAAGARARSVHRSDRQQIEVVLAGLTDQYLKFTALSLENFARSQSWALKVGDRHDVAALGGFVRSSPLVNYGAALVGLTGRPISFAAGRFGLPPANDPGYRPLETSLLAGQIGVSSVMKVHQVPLVAVGVPVFHGKLPVALIIGYADISTWPLQTYVERLKFGATAEPFVLDQNGVVAAGYPARFVGQPAPGLAQLPQLHARPSGVLTFPHAGLNYIASFAPVRTGGWTVLTEQSADVFEGDLVRANTKTAVALLILLLVAMGTLVAFNHFRNRALRRVADDALYDPTTGLPQRRLLLDRLDRAVTRHRRQNDGVAVLFCDMDGFKEINDRFGHNRGDNVLNQVGLRLREALREEDTVARYGGDEFVIVVEGVVGEEEGSQLARRVLNAAVQPMEVAGQHLKLGMSIGVAVVEPGQDVSAEHMLQSADLAMYDAKVAGTGWRTVSVSATHSVLQIPTLGGARSPEADPQTR